MKYASSPYPTVQFCFVSSILCKISHAAWADGSGLSRTYGTKILDIQDTGITITNSVVQNASGNLSYQMYSPAETRMVWHSTGATDTDAAFTLYANGGALGSVYSEIGQNSTYGANAYAGGSILF